MNDKLNKKEKGDGDEKKLAKNLALDVIFGDGSTYYDCKRDLDTFIDHAKFALKEMENEKENIINKMVSDGGFDKEIAEDVFYYIYKGINKQLAD